MSTGNSTLIRRSPLAPLPHSRMCLPTRWLCPPPGAERMPSGFKTQATNVAHWLADAAEAAKKAAQAQTRATVEAEQKVWRDRLIATRAAQLQRSMHEQHTVLAAPSAPADQPKAAP